MIIVAHIAGLPIEEALLGVIPALLATGGYYRAQLRSRLGR